MIIWEDKRKKFFTTSNDIEKIFHYTSINGMKSILENREIWFSNVQFMNDESELFYTYKLVLSNLKTLRKQLNTSLFDKIYNFYDDIVSKQKIPEYQMKKYIACFSVDNDSLNMWNYYTKNINGIGFNIEFDKKSLFDCISNQENKKIFDTSRISCRSVVYDSLEQNKLISEAILDINKVPITNIEDEELLFLQFKFIIDDYSIFFKYPKFSVEKEYRIVIPTQDDNNKPQFREYHGCLIPYYELSFDTSVIHSIRFSPTIRENYIRESIRKFLDAQNLNNIDCYPSDIPLRY